MITEEKIRNYYIKRFKISFGKIKKGSLNDFYHSARAYAIYASEVGNMNSKGINSSIEKYSKKLLKGNLSAVDNYVSEMNFL